MGRARSGRVSNKALSLIAGPLPGITVLWTACYWPRRAVLFRLTWDHNHLLSESLRHEAGNGDNRDRTWSPAPPRTWQFARRIGSTIGPWDGGPTTIPTWAASGS